MQLNDYLTRNRVVILKRKTRRGAFAELVRVLVRDVDGVDRDTLLRALGEREDMLTTRIAPGIAIPHARIEGLDRCLIAVGMSREGIQYDRMEGGLVRLVFMIVSGSADHLKALGLVAALLRQPGFLEQCAAAADRDDLYARLVSGPSSEETSPDLSHITRAICDQALQLAGHIDAAAVMFHDLPPALRASMTERAAESRLIFTVTGPVTDRDEAEGICTIEVPFRGLSRASHIEVSMLLALSKHVIRKGERIVSVFGLAPHAVDTIVVTDVNRAFKTYFSVPPGSHPGDMAQEVFIRVLQLATELATEGREGKPVGTLFVTGDNEKVAQHCQQMVINPFKGYDENERNILDPSLSETVKEFSHIDGAFIVRGDGVIVSAGTYLRADHPVDNLPSGLGARHAAAAAITAITAAVAVTVSESTRRVSIFRAGQRIMEI